MNHEYDCPLCGEHDAVQNVAYLVDSQTESSVGGAVGYNLSGGGFTPAVFAASTHSNLVNRFTPPTPPGNLPLWFISLAFFVGPILVAIYLKNLWMPNVGNDWWFSWALWTLVLYIPAIFVFAVIFFVTWGIYRAMSGSARRQWAQRCDVVNAAYYCLRDDIVFDGARWGSPETYVNHVFNTDKTLELKVG
jgi:hypothetical protein